MNLRLIVHSSPRADSLVAFRRCSCYSHTVASYVPRSRALPLCVLNLVLLLAVLCAMNAVHSILRAPFPCAALLFPPPHCSLPLPLIPSLHHFFQPRCRCCSRSGPRRCGRLACVAPAVQCSHFSLPMSVLFPSPSPSASRGAPITSLNPRWAPSAPSCLPSARGVR